MDDSVVEKDPQKPSGFNVPPDSTLTFQEAIKRGEYDPKFLEGFAIWHTLSRDVQFEYIREALKNREKQYVVQFAEINNVLDFSKKPQLQQVLNNIQQKIQKLREEKERLYIEYTKPE